MVAWPGQDAELFPRSGVGPVRPIGAGRTQNLLGRQPERRLLSSPAVGHTAAVDTLGALQPVEGVALTGDVPAGGAGQSVVTVGDIGGVSLDLGGASLLIGSKVAPEPLATLLPSPALALISVS